MENAGVWVIVNGALLLDAWAVWRVVATRRFLARAVHASGTVLGAFREEAQHWKGQGEASETVVHFYPEVAFDLPDGSRITFRSRASSEQPPSVGETVTVVYDPGAPAATATLAGAGVWQPVAVWVILAGLATIAALVLAVGAVLE
jgi:hypothetical protein